MSLPVVTSAIDAARALLSGQEVAFHSDVADQLAKWGFHIVPAPGYIPHSVDSGRVKLASDILSGLHHDFAINSPDPVILHSDSQPGVILPDVTVILAGPLPGVPGDGTMLLIARLNPDGSPAYLNPWGVTGTTRPAGLLGFGQATTGIPDSRAVVAAVPLPSGAASQLDMPGAGQIVAFSGTTAGQVLAKVPFIGGTVSAVYSGAQASETSNMKSWVQFAVDVVTGGGGLAGQFARVAVPGLGTLQVVADFTNGDGRSITQGIVTLLTAPLAIMFGPGGAAAQGAARWLSGKIYDYFQQREVNAAMDQVAAWKDAAALRQAEELANLSPEELSAYQSEQSQTAQAGDIRAAAADLAAQTGTMPDAATVADHLGLDVSTVSAALGESPPETGTPTVDVSLTPADVAPAPGDVVGIPPGEVISPVPTDTPVPEVTDITGQPVLPPAPDGGTFSVIPLTPSPIPDATPPGPAPIDVPPSPVSEPPIIPVAAPAPSLSPNLQALADLEKSGVYTQYGCTAAWPGSIEAHLAGCAEYYNTHGYNPYFEHQAGGAVIPMMPDGTPGPPISYIDLMAYAAAISGGSAT